MLGPPGSQEALLSRKLDDGCHDKSLIAAMTSAQEGSSLYTWVDSEFLAFTDIPQFQRSSLDAKWRRNPRNKPSKEGYLL